MLEAAGWKGERLVGIAPGAANGTAKQWHPDRMAQVAAQLITHHGVSVAILGSSGDRPAAREVVERVEASRVPLGTRAQPGRPHVSDRVNRRHCPLRRIPVERLGSDAPGVRARRACRRGVRTNA